MDRKQLAESLRGREVRRLAVDGFELREADGVMKLSGVASVTDTPYSMGYYTEVIKRGAFTKTLSENPDVQLLINHDGLPIARTGRNMTLVETDRGLQVDADLNPDLPRVRELALTASDGLIDQMSFAFRVVRQNWYDEEVGDGGFDHRDILEVNIDRGDVSVVNQGASPTTSFSLRDARDLLGAMSNDEFVEFMRSIRPDTVPEAEPGEVTPLSPAPSVAEFAHALTEVRANNLDDATMATLQRVLDMIDASDTNVDKALIVLSDLMGVTNPDIAQDKALDRTHDLKLYEARLFALKMRAA